MGQSRRVLGLRPALLVLTAALLSACQTPPPKPSIPVEMTRPLPGIGKAQPTEFEPWRARHAEEVDALSQLLAREGVLEVLPLSQVLRSAADWQMCRAEPYAIPPRGQWPSVVSVLRLVRTLRQEGIIGSIEVSSGHRPPPLNACAGGAPRSAHALSFALDFMPLDGRDITPRLCAFWRRHGKTWNMGFSRYPSGRIHVDTAGYRTWGADHTGKTAVCSPEP